MQFEQGRAVSFAALEWATRGLDQFRDHLTSTDRVVLLHLAHAANDEHKGFEGMHVCWLRIGPSDYHHRRTVTWRTGLSRHSVKRSLRKLEELGLLTRYQQFEIKRGQMANMYELHVPET